MERDKDRDKFGMTHTVLRHLDLLVIREIQHQKVITLPNRLLPAVQYLLVQGGHPSTQPPLQRVVFLALAAVPK